MHEDRRGGGIWEEKNEKSKRRVCDGWVSSCGQGGGYGGGSVDSGQRHFYPTVDLACCVHKEFFHLMRAIGQLN